MRKADLKRFRDRELSKLEGDVLKRPGDRARRKKVKGETEINQEDSREQGMPRRRIKGKTNVETKHEMQEEIAHHYRYSPAYMRLCLR